MYKVAQARGRIKITKMAMMEDFNIENPALIEYKK